MSDWFGTESRVPPLKAGLDLEMPAPSKWRGQPLIEDIKSGRVDVKLIDERVLEVLKFVSRTSEFLSTAAEEAGEDEATNALTRRLASESFVLLKNEADTLPLNMESRPRMAVVGQLAVEYSGAGAVQLEHLNIHNDHTTASKLYILNQTRFPSRQGSKCIGVYHYLHQTTLPRRTAKPA